MSASGPAMLELTDTEMSAEISAIATLITAVRAQLDALPTPPSPSLDELRQGLDVAWISAVRLAAELTPPVRPARR